MGPQMSTKKLICVTNVLRSSFLSDKKAHLSRVFLRDKKAHLSHVIFYELFVTYFPTAEILFYLMPSVIINRFANAFFIKTLSELLIIISLIQEIDWLNLKAYTETYLIPFTMVQW
jgi:hypothetical protein